MSSQRQTCLELLEWEVRNNTGWTRVHAAEALLDHGQRACVAEEFGRDTGRGTATARIGLWRVMARAAAPGKERRSFLEKIREVMLDSTAADRLQAVESLCKLGAGNPEDQTAINAWLLSADDATAAFPCWYLVLSSSGEAQSTAESRLAGLLDSADEVARLRAAFAIGRLKHVAAATRQKLEQRLGDEPQESSARVYLVIARLRHSTDSQAGSRLRQELIRFATRGKPGEQLAAATALGALRHQEDVTTLSLLLKAQEADARIGAANGLLHLLP